MVGAKSDAELILLTIAGLLRDTSDRIRALETLLVNKGVMTPDELAEAKKLVQAQSAVEHALNPLLKDLEEIRESLRRRYAAEPPAEG